MNLSDLEKHEEWSHWAATTVRCSLVPSRTWVNPCPVSGYPLGFIFFWSNVWWSMNFQATNKANGLLPKQSFEDGVTYIWSQKEGKIPFRQLLKSTEDDVHGSTLKIISQYIRDMGKTLDKGWRKNQTSTNDSFSRKSRIWILDTFGFKTLFLTWLTTFISIKIQSPFYCYIRTGNGFRKCRDTLQMSFVCYPYPLLLHLTGNVRTGSHKKLRR